MKMILFTILLLTLLILTTITVVAISLGGAAFIVVFGDVIVCIVFIALLIKFLTKRKRR
jgi:hypothetical protein